VAGSSGSSTVENRRVIQEHAHAYFVLTSGKDLVASRGDGLAKGCLVRAHFDVARDVSRTVQDVTSGVHPAVLEFVLDLSDSALAVARNDHNTLRVGGMGVCKDTIAETGGSMEVVRQEGSSGGRHCQVLVQDCVAGKQSANGCVRGLVVAPVGVRGDQVAVAEHVHAVWKGTEA